MAVRYRFADTSDADALGALHTRSWRAAYRGLIDQAALDGLDPADKAAQFLAMLDPGSRDERAVVWIVAELDGDPVGHAIAQRHEDEGHLHALYLDPDHFGTGVGPTLHDMALRALRRIGCNSATLRVLDGNDRAIGFYERRGWRLTGNRYEDEWSGIAVVDLEMAVDLDVDLLLANRKYWNEQAPIYAAKQTWNPEIDWGIFGITDAEAGHIFPDVDAKDVVELGCGTAYVSSWCHNAGARTVVGLDNSPAQLATAARRSADAGWRLPLVLGDAHRLPFADDSFDVAINEYGAAIWCDPRIWIPEAARVLRPGGTLWFLGNSVQFMLCAPEFEDQLAGSALLRPQRGMHRFEWIDTDNIEFHVSHGEMVSILTGAGFVIEALHELYSPADATTSYGLADGDWASRWPVEEVWVARLGG